MYELDEECVIMTPQHTITLPGKVIDIGVQFMIYMSIDLYNNGTIIL